jgi:putative tricarboxylic transport membrane protein
MRRSLEPRVSSRQAGGASRRQALAGLAAGAAALAAGPRLGLAQADQRLHFIVPAAAGGGWDQTARAVAEALTRAGLVRTTTLEHVSGGGGARAIGYLISTGQSQQQTLLVSSTPIVLRAVRGASPSYRELQPVASVIGDYAVIAVRADSPHRDFASVAAAVRRAPGELRIAGGSVRGGMDHLLAARMFNVASGVEPRAVRYLPYDAGGGALEALLTNQVEVLSSGLGEVLAASQSRDIRVLAVTAPERLAEAPDVPALRELGHDVTFVNWRGFFAAPQLPAATADDYAALLGQLVETPEWDSIRGRHGWQKLYHARADFQAFLEAEEAVARQYLTALGLA